MLRFFFTRDNIPPISTQDAEPFELLNAAEFKNEIIPFSHMYITSDAYLKQIQYALKDNKDAQIVKVSERQSTVILNQPSFPPNLTEYRVNSFAEYKALLGGKHDIHIAIINGVGGNYGDNYIGLGIIQRINKLLAPMRIHFHLMQSLHLRFNEIYKDNASATIGNIICQNNIMTVEKFMSMDAYIDLSSIVNFTEYGNLSRSQFFLTAFSLENLIPDNNVQPYLSFDPDDSANVRKKIYSRFSDKKPLALLHLISSDKIKVCPATFTHELIESLIKKGFNVISPNSIDYSSPSFCDCSDLVNSTSKLTSMIDASDCVVSTGSLSMNIAASLGKATILLPITKSNIRTAKKLSEVLIWVTHENKKLYFDAVKVDPSKHFQIAQQIWQNISTDKLASAIKNYSKRFHRNTIRTTSKVSPKRLGIIILFSSDEKEFEKKLNHCLDKIAVVEGFNPLWLEIIDARFEHVSLTHAFNSGIGKAIKNDCDYIWILDPLQIPNPNYFSKALKRFESNSSIGIVAGMQIDNENTNRSIWSGSRLSFPKRQFKAGNIKNTKLSKPSLEDWVPFQSVIIRAEAAIDIGLLDEALQQQFSDADYCFRLKERGWRIVYEPKAKTYKLGHNHNPTFTDEQKDILMSDMKYFFHKWSRITHCKSSNDLHSAIIKHVDKKARRHKKRKQLSDEILNISSMKS